MSNAYTNGHGSKPILCFNSPIPPDLGSNPPVGPPASSPMVTAANPFQPCGPPSCPATSCCGGPAGGAMPGGGLHGDGGGGIPGALPG